MLITLSEHLHTVHINHYVFCAVLRYVCASSKYVLFIAFSPSLSPFRLLGRSNQWSRLKPQFFIGINVNLSPTTF